MVGGNPEGTHENIPQTWNPNLLPSGDRTNPLPHQAALAGNNIGQNIF